MTQEKNNTENTDGRTFRGFPSLCGNCQQNLMENVQCSWNQIRSKNETNQVAKEGKKL